jgi:ribosomal protein L29
MRETPSLARLRDLTAENRREPDSERERELLALRHQIALERLGDPGPLRPAKPSPKDLPIEDGLAVVDGSEVDAATVRRAITHHGSLLVRRLVSEQDVRCLVSVVDHAFASFDAASAAVPEVDNAWFAPLPGRECVDATRSWLRTKGGVLTGDSARATFEVSEVFTSSGIDLLAEEYLGQPPIVSLDKWTLRRGIVENGIEWHQDGAFLGTEVRAFNVWLSLSECGLTAPSLDLVPRRLDDIVPTGTDGATYSWSVSDGAIARVAGPGGWCRPCFRPGDALLFDDKLLHRTGGSPTMTQERYAIETWFFAPSGDTSYVDVPVVL